MMGMLFFSLKWWKRFLYALQVLLFCSLGMASTACDPCVALSDLIGDCEPSANGKLACRQERDLQRSQRDEADADLAVCSAALETCNCDAIENHDWEACGMTRDTVPQAEDIATEASR